MKKLTKSFVALLFCVVFAVMTMSTAFAAANMANVTNLKANADTDSVTLTWSSVKGADGYQIEQKSGSSWKSLNSKYTKTSYTIEKLDSATTYTFRVRAYDKKLVSTDTSKEWTEVKAITAPDKVSGVKVTNYSGTALKISWSKVTGADGYQVYRSTNGKKWSKVASTTSTSYVNKNLSYNKAYQYKVRAYVKDGSTVYGAYSSVVKKTTAIPAPANFKISKSSYNYITLSWDKVDGAKDYQIQKSTDGKKWSDLKTTTSTSFKDSKANVGSTYYYRIRTRQVISKKTKASPYSSVVSKKLALGAVDLKIGAVGRDNVTLEWDAIAGAEGYQVYYNTTSSTKGWTKGSTVKKSTTTTIKGLAEGKKYYFWVRAFREVSSKNVYGSYGTANATVGLATVTNLFVVDTTDTTVSLKWDSVKDATGYKVYYSKDGAKEVGVNFSTNSGTITKLSSTSDYTFRVKAYAKYKSGSTTKTSLSKDYSAKVSVPAACSFFATAYGDEIRLSFKSDAKVNGYLIEYKPENGAWDAIETSENSYVFDGLDASTAYEFKIKSYIKSGDFKNYSLEASLTATTGTDNVGTLYWAPVEGAVKYQLEYFDQLKSNWQVKANLTENMYSCSAETAQPAGNLFKVTAIDKNDKAIKTFEPVTVFKCDSYSLTVKKNNTIDLTWAPVAGAKYYAICEKVSPVYLHYRKCAIVTDTSIKDLCIPAGGIRTLFIIAYAEKPSYANNIIWTNSSGSMNSQIVCFVSPELNIETDKTAAGYDASVNAQLLTLASAINKSKQTGNVTIEKKSSFSTEIKAMKIGSLDIDFEELDSNPLIPSSIKKEIKNFLASEDMTEKEELTLTFPENGIATYVEKLEDGTEKTRTIRLSTFIEPQNSSYAYIYNSDNNSAWKNGFDSVTTTKNKDGSITIVAKLKKESFGTKTKNEKTLYHCGFISDISQVGMADLYHTNSSVGATTITAVIDADGLLVSYAAKSPYTMDMEGTMSTDDGTETEMGMKSVGNYDVSYKFTR